MFLALGGEARIAGPKGKRSVAADDFFVGMLQSALADDEILTELVLPLATNRAGAAYRKLRQPASGFAVVGAAVQLTADRKGRIDEIRIGVTGVNPVPFRAQSVEKRLRGQAPDAAALRALCAQHRRGRPERRPARLRRVPRGISPACSSRAPSAAALVRASG